MDGDRGRTFAFLFGFHDEGRDESVACVAVGEDADDGKNDGDHVREAGNG